jgi:large subunit ribosomal protein L15
MKLHDLRPAEGSRTAKTRVGRGIAAGKGKTAGRGTKGQKARAGGSIPPWFEGGQTPLHMRIPKLRGFKNRFKIQYEVVNVGAIEAAVERGALVAEAPGKGKAKAGSQITVNQDLLRAVGLVRSLNKPLKILGNGDLSAPLFVVADAFTGSARTKIEAAGGTVSVLEVPTRPLKAIGLDDAAASETTTDEARGTADAPVKGKKAARFEAAKAGRAARATAATAAKAAKAAGASKAETAAAPAKGKKAAKPAPTAKAEAADASVDEPVEATAAPDAPAEAVAAAATDETTESAAADATDDQVETAPGDDA